MKRDKLAHIKPTENSFKVPKGYFDTVEDAIFAKLAVEKLSKKEGFSTPDSYFDTIEDSVFEKIQKENKQAVQLPNDGKSGFTIPENYLETVEETISAKLNDTTTQVPVIDFKAIILKRVIPLAVAASLLLFIVVNYNSKTISFETIASAEIEQWIEADLITLETYEIAEVYNDTELENQPFSTEDESELIDYLNGIDIESILLEN